MIPHDLIISLLPLQIDATGNFNETVLAEFRIWHLFHVPFGMAHATARKPCWSILAVSSWSTKACASFTCTTHRYRLTNMHGCRRLCNRFCCSIHLKSQAPFLSAFGYRHPDNHREQCKSKKITQYKKIGKNWIDLYHPWPISRVFPPRNSWSLRVPKFDALKIVSMQHVTMRNVAHACTCVSATIEQVQFPSIDNKHLGRPIFLIKMTI